MLPMFPPCFNLCCIQRLELDYKETIEYTIEILYVYVHVQNTVLYLILCLPNQFVHAVLPRIAAFMVCHTSSLMTQLYTTIYYNMVFK